jgi:hypothetical protein
VKGDGVMSRRWRLPLLLAAAGVVVVAAVAIVVVSVTKGRDKAYRPVVDPARFSATITNPYLPLKPGTRWTYQGSADGQPSQKVVEVTTETQQILGVGCVTVRDTMSANGTVVEDTVDWYAQDSDGTVWYFGEDTKEYENGTVVSTKGTWKAGVDGAQPGIAMKANPAVGDRYRQEYYPGEAEDWGEVLALDEHVAVPAGSFDHALKTRETTPLEHDLVEEKYYATGVGFVHASDVRGGQDRIDLVEVRHP